MKRFAPIIKNDVLFHFINNFTDTGLERQNILIYRQPALNKFKKHQKAHCFHKHTMKREFLNAIGLIKHRLAYGYAADEW